MFSFASGSRGGSTTAGDDFVRSLADSTTKIANDMESLKNRLDNLEMMQRQTDDTASDQAIPDAASDQAIPEKTNPPPTLKKSIQWKDQPVGKLSLGQVFGKGDDLHGSNEDGNPPMTKITFRGASPQNSPTNEDRNYKGGDNDGVIDSDDSSSNSSEEDPIAFSGWARVFFQARREPAAKQVTAPGATPFLDTHLHLTIYATANQLHISDVDDRRRPPLIDPPINLRHFYAARVPGSHSGAALFLRNDPKRRLRKYIFRFEFANRAVHQDPKRYLHFHRSGTAAKNSMRAMHKMKRAMAKMGEERRQQLQKNKKHGENAFTAHLASLDELLRESDDLANRFVECVNAQNEDEEVARLANNNTGKNSQRKRTKPLPPYWGSGYNRTNTNKDELDDNDDDSESADSEEQEELDYDDDDETTFDKVKVTTEQTLETLWKHIVK